jgi:hypothetical protein
MPDDGSYQTGHQGIARCCVTKRCHGVVLLDPGKEALDQVPGFAMMPIEGARFGCLGFWQYGGGFPATLSGSTTRFVGIDHFVGDQPVGLKSGRSRSAPTRSWALPLIRWKPTGLSDASTDLGILVINPLCDCRSLGSGRCLELW